MSKRKKIALMLITLLVAVLFNINGWMGPSHSMNDRGGNSFVRWYKIKFKGDVSAYHDAYIEALDDNFREDGYLNYALIMADKHNYAPAYFDVYWLLYYKQHLYDDTLHTLDRLNESDKKMALNYLIKAKDKGNLEAMKYLGQYYMQGLYFRKDTILGMQLIREANKHSGIE